MALGPEQLERVGTSAGVVAGVLVLHGGTDDKEKAARPARFPWLSWRNAGFIAGAIAERTGRRGVGVWVLRHLLAGWDRDDEPTPVREAREAIEAIHLLYGGLPLVLVGHSMGGRTGVAVADSPGVVGVIGLAPWLPEEQSAEPLRGRHLRVAHARLDRQCPLSSMTSFLERADPIAASVEVADMGWDVHAMVVRRRWNEYAARQTLALLGSPT